MRAVLGVVFGVFLATAFSVSAGNFPGEQPVYGRDQGRTTLLFYKSGGNGDGKVEYICTADPGTATSASRWQITQLTYDSSNRVSEVEWAGGTDNFINVCDSRTSYTYN